MGIWLGTIEKQLEVPYPLKGGTVEYAPWEQVLQFTNGGSDVIQSAKVGATYTLEWGPQNRADHQQVALILSGGYGNGYVYYQNPQFGNFAPVYLSTPSRGLVGSRTLDRFEGNEKVLAKDVLSSAEYQRYAFYGCPEVGSKITIPLNGFRKTYKFIIPQGYAFAYHLKGTSTLGFNLYAANGDTLIATLMPSDTGDLWDGIIDPWALLGTDNDGSSIFMLKFAEGEDEVMLLSCMLKLVANTATVYSTELLVDRFVQGEGATGCRVTGSFTTQLRGYALPEPYRAGAYTLVEMEHWKQ